MRWIVLALGLNFASLVAAQSTDFILAINEGVTYKSTPREIRDRFRLLTEALAKELKRPVRIEAVEDYPQLRAGLDAQQYDLALVHPTHHALKSIKDGKYVALASVKGFTEYRASFLIHKDSTIRQPQDLRGQKIGTPDPDSITAVLTRATLRDLGIDPKKVEYQATRYQDAVPFLIDWGYVAVATTGSTPVVNRWKAQGNAILLQSRPVPVKLIIASTKLPDALRLRLGQLFLSMDTTDGGKKILEQIGYPGFTALSALRIADVTEWLGNALP